MVAGKCGGHRTVTLTAHCPGKACPVTPLGRDWRPAGADRCQQRPHLKPRPGQGVGPPLERASLLQAGTVPNKLMRLG